METEEELKEETLLSHLIELRSRLLKMGASILVVFLVLAPFSAKIWHFRDLTFSYSILLGS